MPKRIVLAGGSGFVGQALAASYLADGYEVHVLSRGAASRKLLGTVVPWDGETVGPWAESLEDATAVINLTGKNINCRPTDANIKEIVHSRVDSVKAVGEAIRKCNRPPRVFVQATAVGIYGNAGDVICDESTPAGGGFLGDTCKAWEKAFDESPTGHPLAGRVRRVMLRLGIVLGRDAGAFPPLAKLTRYFLGGALGSGRQYISWLHLNDAVRMFRAAIDREDMQGVYLAVAPQPVTNADFMRALRTALHRPWSPPVPVFAARIGGLLLGMNIDLALASQRCVPRRLQEQGFAFEYPQLDGALRQLVG
jgi:uncharacterized protein (TIGR01777 family)